MWLINIAFLQLPAKESFPFIRLICHENVIYVTAVMEVTKARHKASFLALQDSQKHFTIGNGGCALTFAGIMFLCIWFSQLYMLYFNKRPLPWP